MIRPSFPCHQTLLASAKSVFCGALLMSCGQGVNACQQHGSTVAGHNASMARMVEAVVGQPVDQLIPDGMDAKEWTPSELQLVQMSESFLISNGRGFEAKLRRYDLPRTSWLRSANVLAEPPVLHDVVEHQHGPEGSHSHGVVDGHTWVDPQTAGKQLEAIRQRLVQEGFCSEEQSRQNVRPSGPTADPPSVLRNRPPVDRLLRQPCGLRLLGSNPRGGTSQPLISIPNLHSQKKWHRNWHR